MAKRGQSDIRKRENAELFVQAKEGRNVTNGVGKLIGREQSLCRVEYFDTPTTDRIVCHIDEKLIEAVTLAQQTRVYHFDEESSSWQIGNLLNDHGDSQFVKFSDGIVKRLDCEFVFVRWGHQIRNATPFLVNRTNEGPEFFESRSSFIRSQLHQRVASGGISALLGCAIELESHQFEVVRRVLQDPVQRYLLADEVGLGKSIEAGILIRQFVLDSKQNSQVLVVVPVSLLSQWHDELCSKFFLKQQIDLNVHLVAMDDETSIRRLLPKIGMLVIDEAHHLTKWVLGKRKEIYADIAVASPTIERVLLLSATPALHNERGFLEMLHLLDPTTYPLNGVEAFRRKVTERQALAEIIAGLLPENALYLDYTIDQLEALFPEDDFLQAHAKHLRSVIEAMPDQTDPRLIEAIDILHAHLSEAYRLDRRILRHRRRSIGKFTPGRSGAKIVRYRSSDRAALTNSIDDWRFNEALNFDDIGSGKLAEDRVSAFRQVIDRASQYPRSGPGMIAFLASKPAMIGDQKKFSLIRDCLGRPGLFEDRFTALIATLRPLLHDKIQCVIFCSDSKTADILTKRIAERLRINVERHDPDDTAWKAFVANPDRAILVCDRRGEEGLNLQGGRKIVVHYDLPFNPNRIEQRIGRVDRYGSVDPVRSLIFACEDDPIETAWVQYLDEALKVFDRSVASLQYLIEQTTNSIVASLLWGGADDLIDLCTKSAGDQGLIEREIIAIDQQDQLDALGAPPVELMQKLLALDDEWETLANDTKDWVEASLQFGRFQEPQFAARSDPAEPFRYFYSTIRQQTLIPLKVFIRECAGVIDQPNVTKKSNSLKHIPHTIKTSPYTFRRRTAMNAICRSNFVRLARLGDPIIDCVRKFTESDDRGRSFLFWRFDPNYTGDVVADIYLRFDFIVEVDVSEVEETLLKYGKNTSTAIAAVQRRGDIALPAFQVTILLNRELEVVRDNTVVAILTQPYQMEAGSKGTEDLDLSNEYWNRLLQLRIPEVDFWPEFCAKAGIVAESALRKDRKTVESLFKAEQHAMRSFDERIRLLRARFREGSSISDPNEIEFEERLATALLGGIRTPQITIDGVGAIFVSANRTVTQYISGGIDDYA